MSDTVKITLLHSNDMHGDFLPEEKEGKSTGGVSLLSGFLKKNAPKTPTRSMRSRAICLRALSLTVNTRASPPLS